jgi:hypothetical protein
VGDLIFKVDGHLYPVAEQDALSLAKRSRAQAGDDPLSAAAVFIEEAVQRADEFPELTPEEKRHLRQALQAWGLSPEGYDLIPESLRELRYALDAEAQ